MSAEKTVFEEKSILVVEDDKSIALNLQLQLRQFGYTVSAAASSGNEAISLAESLRPDLVLMDVKLKGPIDGVTVAQVLYKRFEIPTVFLTAFADEEILRRALPIEPYGYVLKPHSKRELYLVLELALRRRESELDRIRAREVLAAANSEQKKLLERYRSIFDSTPSGLVVHQSDGRIVECNPAAERILGLKRDHILGRTNFDPQWNAFASTRHPLPSDHLPAVLTFKTGSSVRDFEMELRKADRTSIWIVVNTEPIRAPDGAITHAVVSFSDITLQREALGFRRKMDARIKAAVGASRMVLWEWDIERGDFAVSACGGDCILGYSDRKLIRTTTSGWIENTHPEDRVRVEKSLNQALAGIVSTWSIEHRLKAADGSWRWVRQMGRITERAEDGRPTMMVGTTQDEHEKHLNEEQSKLSARRLQLALADSKIGVWSYNIQTEESIWDERTFDIFSIEKGTPKPRDILFERIHPEDRPTVVKSLEAALSGTSVFEYTFRFVRPNGVTSNIRSFGSVQTDNNGRPEWISGVCEDVTEKLAVELEHCLESELLAQATKSARLGVWRYGLQDQKLIWSRRMLEIFGVDRTLTLQEFMKYVHPEDLDRVAETERRARAGSADEQIEFRIISREGKTLYLQNEMSIHLGSDGRPEWLAGVCQDVTERRQLHERQRALEAELARSQKLETIGTFAGGIAHDFNNLLTGILGFVDMAIQRVDGDRVATSLLQNSKDGAVRARELVKHLLLFARKGPEFQSEPFDVSTVVKETASLLSTMVPPTVVISTEIHDLNAFVMGNPGQIHQVLMNLGVNASHAIGSKAGRLTFCVHLAAPAVNSDATESVCISVVDTGCGMNDEIKSRIFDPFYTTKGSSGGTGLGLSIAHGIIADHHGSISVQSTSGRGTTFMIKLPLTSERPLEPRREAANQPLEGQARRILVADDRPEVRKFVSIALKNFGFEVVDCDGGESAISRISTDACSLSAVLLDLAMPGVDGLQVLDVIQSVRPNLPVILMSGNYDGFNSTPHAKFENVRRLPKPFTVQELVDSVRSIFKVE